MTKLTKHLTIYDSNNAKCAAGLITSVECTSISEAYNARNNRKFETSNDFKNFYWTSSLLLGTTTMCNSSTCIPSNMRKTQYFRNCLMKTNILAITQTKESTLTQSWQWHWHLTGGKNKEEVFYFCWENLLDLFFYVLRVLLVWNYLRALEKNNWLSKKKKNQT